MRYGILLLLLIMLGGCQKTPSNSAQPTEPTKVSCIVQLTDSDFIEKTRKGVVLLDAYAVWCGPCRMMEPELEKVAETLQGKILVARIDAEANREFARAHRITGYPTLFIFVDGKLTETFLGATNETGLFKLVEKYIREPQREPEPMVPETI